MPARSAEPESIRFAIVPEADGIRPQIARVDTIDSISGTILRSSIRNVFYHCFVIESVIMELPERSLGFPKSQGSNWDLTRRSGVL